MCVQIESVCKLIGISQTVFIKNTSSSKLLISDKMACVIGKSEIGESELGVGELFKTYRFGRCLCMSGLFGSDNVFCSPAYC